MPLDHAAIFVLNKMLFALGFSGVVFILQLSFVENYKSKLFWNQIGGFLTKN
jgi:hypothetical protein